MKILSPYLLFLGDTKDPLSVKTSRGIAQWRPERTVGQISMPGCEVTLNLPELDFETAVQMGAKTFILGLANAGGVISEDWLPYLRQALENGMDIASGLHNKVADIPEIKQLADRLGRHIFDVRHPTQTLSVGNGKKRSGKRILAVGTDCSVGKMYTTLALEQEMKARGLNADFRATGQTGILIDGRGISVDAVVADFISGAVEALAPDNSEDHWDIIEGQGSLFHPSYAGVSLGLLHGAQADVLILCHEVGRKHIRGLPHQPLPHMQACINANLGGARLTNKQAMLGGIALNSSALNEQEARDYCQKMSDTYQVPCVDPLRHGTKTIVDFILSQRG
ncbi:MAG: DUF1611 domain-containing protein [Emcibacter sp.]|nr:DUF1611 domain-containing protein [Emcibacter sp.]